MLASWIISDGDPSRRHRLVVMDPKWRLMGIAAAKHNSIYKTVGLATFCSSYKSNSAVIGQMSSFNHLWDTGS